MFYTKACRLSISAEDSFPLLEAAGLKARSVMAQDEGARRKQARAMAQSSWAWMTKTRAGEAAVAMSASPEPALELDAAPLALSCVFFAASRLTPAKASASQAAARTSAEFSPMPAVKTSASRPPRTAIIE